MITGERLKTLGRRVISLNDSLIDEVAEKQGIRYSTVITYEHFQAFYFEVFEKVDQTFAKESQIEEDSGLLL